MRGRTRRACRRSLHTGAGGQGGAAPQIPTRSALVSERTNRRDRMAIWDSIAGPPRGRPEPPTHLDLTPSGGHRAKGSLSTQAPCPPLSRRGRSTCSPSEWPTSNTGSPTSLRASSPTGWPRSSRLPPPTPPSLGPTPPLHLKGVADYLNVSPRFVEGLVSSDELVPIRVRSVRRFSVDAHSAPAPVPTAGSRTARPTSERAPPANRLCSRADRWPTSAARKTATAPSSMLRTGNGHSRDDRQARGHVQAGRPRPPTRSARLAYRTSPPRSLSSPKRWPSAPDPLIAQALTGRAPRVR